MRSKALANGWPLVPPGYIVSTGGGVDPSPIVAIHPDDYANKPTQAYSYRRLSAAYAGSCATSRGNNPTTVVTSNFQSAARDALMDETSLVAFNAANVSNTEFRIQTWGDQYGSLPLVPASQAAGLRLKRSAENAGGFPSSKATANLQGLSTNAAAATGPFNIGGAGDKLSLILSMAINGFGGAFFGTSNPGTASSQAGTALGISNDAATELLSLSETESIGSTEITYGSVAVLRDDINALFERSTTWGRRRTIGLRFDGTMVAGFCGSKKCFERTLTLAEFDAVRIWLGSAGTGGQTANAEYFEFDVWNNILVPDADMLGLIKNVGTFWNAYNDPAETNDLTWLWTDSQSNGVYSDSDGHTAMLAALKPLLGTNAALHRMTGGTAANDSTAFGGSAMQKAAADNNVVGDGLNYWVEQDGVTPGPRLITAKTNVAAALRKGQDWVGLVAIGEQEAKGINQTSTTYSGTVGDPLFGQANKASYKTSLLRSMDQMEVAVGHAPLQWVIVSLHKQDMYSAAYDVIRQAQIEFAAAYPGRVKFVSASLDLALRPDNIHWLAADIVAKLVPRLANIIAKAKKPALALNVKGPTITSVTFTDGTRTAIKVKIAHATNGGTDFTPTTGISGFRVVDANGVKTLGTVVRAAADEITVPLIGVAVGATTLQYIYGTDHDPANVVVDDAAIKFPLEATVPMSVT